MLFKILKRDGLAFNTISSKKPGLFDNIDKLYGKKDTEEVKPAEGGSEPYGGPTPPSSDFGDLGGGLESPSEEPAPAEEPAGETVPESDFNKESLNILLENTGMLGEDEVIDLSKAKKEGKPKRNRANLIKRLKTIEKNVQLLNEYSK